MHMISGEGELRPIIMDVRFFCRSEKTFKMWFIIDLSGKETISEFNILYRIILERGEHFFFIIIIICTLYICILIQTLK